MANRILDTIGFIGCLILIAILYGLLFITGALIIGADAVLGSKGSIMKFTGIACPKCKTGAIMEEEGEYGKWYTCLNCGYVAKGEGVKNDKGVNEAKERG